MAQIVKITCPDCGHIHKLNSNRFPHKKIKVICRNCKVGFVFDHTSSHPNVHSKKIVNQTNKKDVVKTEKVASNLSSRYQELEVKWNHALRIYWAWLWRSLLFSILFGGIFGFGLGFIASMLNLINIQPLFTLFGVIVGIVVSIWMLRNILRKKFKGFHIALIRDSSN